MTAVTSGFQMTSVGVFVATLLLVTWGVRHYPAYWREFTPPAIFAGYGLVYYGLVLSGLLTPTEVLMWGAVHRFLAAVVVFGGLAALLWALGGRRGGR